MQTLARSLNGSAIQAFWSGTSFLLCSTGWFAIQSMTGTMDWFWRGDIVFQPSFASLSSIFGRKPILLIALTSFLVGTIVASCAQNFTQMLIGRSIQGFGGGGLISITEVIMADLIPLRLRGHYFGVLNFVWSLGSVTGPILGAGFSQKVTWVRRNDKNGCF